MLFYSFILNNNSVEKNINKQQQTLFFLKKDQAYTTKKITNLVIY